MKRYTSFSISVCAWRLFLSVLLLVAFVAGPQAAQLKGKVTVNDTQPLPDALIKVQEAGSKRLVVTRTGDDGSYVAGNLARGRHLLRIEKHGRALYQGFVDIRGATAQKNVNLRGGSDR